MQVHIYVDGVQVGARIGCDVLIGDRSCMQAAVGAPFYHAGAQRDICVACMARLGPGSPVLQFASHHYDIANEAYSTEAPKADPPVAPMAPAPPAFPACPHCGERTFAVTQVLSESRIYRWQAENHRFVTEGDPSVDQAVQYRCQACGGEVSAPLLSSWIQ